MSNVIDYWEWRRARLGGGRCSRNVPPINRRARTNRREGGGGGFVRLGTVSGEIVRLLRE